MKSTGQLLMRACLVALLGFFLVGNTARAGDYDGTWIITANGWSFTMKLEEKCDVITGTLTGINNDQKSTVEGKIKGTEITFTRDNGQEYHGFLMTDDPTGKTSKLTMAGTFKSGDAQSAWVAKR